MKLVKTKNKPEANLQAELYYQCRLAGIDNILLEYKLPKEQVKGKRGCRFDAVIFDDNQNIILLIEIKSRGSKERSEIFNSKQVKKYREYGIPINVINKDTDIQDFVRRMKKWMSTIKGGGSSL